MNNWGWGDGFADYDDDRLSRETEWRPWSTPPDIVLPKVGDDDYGLKDAILSREAARDNDIYLAGLAGDHIRR